MPGSNQADAADLPRPAHPEQDTVVASEGCKSDRVEDSAKPETPERPNEPRARESGAGGDAAKPARSVTHRTDSGTDTALDRRADAVGATLRAYLKPRPRPRPGRRSSMPGLAAQRARCLEIALGRGVPGHGPRAGGDRRHGSSSSGLRRCRWSYPEHDGKERRPREPAANPRCLSAPQWRPALR
jgi:hypothetical protein